MTVLKEELNLYSKFVRKQGFQLKATGSSVDKQRRTADLFKKS